MMFIISWISSSLRSSLPKYEPGISVVLRFNQCQTSSKNQPMRVQKSDCMLIIVSMTMRTMSSTTKMMPITMLVVSSVVS